MPVEEIFNFFIERHIVLKEDWLNAAITSLKGSGINSKFCEAVYEQWLYSDLSESTYPIFDQVGISNDSRKNVITTPFVAQVTSIVDVGSSLYSQFKTLTYEFVDNSGFDALPEQENPNEFAVSIPFTIFYLSLFSKPKRMLSITISDGAYNARAIEHFAIPQINLLLTPGCKVLFLPSIISRKGILMLKASNIQILGGDVEHLMKAGRPLEVMTSLLGIASPVQETKELETEASMNIVELNVKSVNRELNRTLLQPSPSSSNQYLQDDDFDCAKDPSPPSDDYNFQVTGIVESDDDSSVPALFKRKSTVVEEQRNSQTLVSLFSMARPKTKRKSAIVEVKPNPVTPKQSQTFKGCLSTAVAKPNPVIRLEDSPPNFDAECPDYTPSGPDYTTNSRITRKRSFVLSKCLDSSSTQASHDTSLDPWTPPKPIGTQKPELEKLKTKNHTNNYESFVSNSQNVITIPERITPKSPPPKKVASSNNIQRTVKLEIIDLSDDEVVTPSPALSAPTDSPAQPVPAVESNGYIDQLCKSPMNSVYCDRFDKLKIMKIVQASRQSRFVVGSIRCKIQAVVVEIKEALRIVDNVWTQKVLLMDESSTISCYIDNETLVSLIGWTTEQAMEIKRSSDSVRRKEGSRRLAAVSTQMQRLDLLFDVEFYSEGLADAVVRSIQTLPQALELLS
ncbi:unnamed protein product [Auanema sp. JU1783]|nr:unnamed protein product [Auanema sp. JU1783]